MSKDINSSISEMVSKVLSLHDLSSADLHADVTSNLVKVINEHKAARLLNSLSDLSDTVESFTFKSKRSSAGSVDYIFNDRYRYTYTADSSLEELEDFISYLSNHIPALRQLNLNTPMVDALPSTDTPSAPALPPSTDAPRDHILSPLTEMDIDESKKHSVAKLKSVKAGIDEAAKKFKSDKFNARKNELTKYVDTVENADLFLELATEWLTDPANDSTMDVLELSKLLRSTVTGIDPVVGRTLLEVANVNLADKLKSRVSLNTPANPTYVPMSSYDKEYMVRLALGKMHIVNYYQHLYDFDVAALAVYIIDYCAKNSSLTISETPEEIVTLTHSMYNLLLSKNLDPEFIYTADVNSQYGVERADWIEKNSAVQCAMAMLDEHSPESIQPAALEIAAILDVQLDVGSPLNLPTDVKKLIYTKYTQLEELDGLGRLVSTDDLLIVGSDFQNPSFRIDKTYEAVIVVYKDVAFSLVASGPADGILSEVYTEATTHKLVKWLTYLSIKLGASNE